MNSSRIAARTTVNVELAERFLADPDAFVAGFTTDRAELVHAKFGAAQFIIESLLATIKEQS